MKWQLAAGWVLAVVVTTALAWQIVAVADEQVGDAPVSPIEAAPPSTSGDTTTSTISDPTIATGPSSSTTSTSGTTTTSETGTTSASESGSTTSTTPPTTSSPTTSAASWTTKTVTSNGGTVVVSYRPGEVRLETAVPLPGFQVEVEKSGPPEVDVEFESSSLRVRVKADWDDGALEVDIEDSPEKEEDD